MSDKVDVQEIEGRKAAVAYMTDDFEPAPSKEAATLIKVTYLDNGEVIFLAREATR